MSRRERKQRWIRTIYEALNKIFSRINLDLGQSIDVEKWNLYMYLDDVRQRSNSLLRFPHYVRDRLFEEMETDGDGELSIDEFIDYMGDFMMNSVDILALCHPLPAGAPHRCPDPGETPGDLHAGEGRGINAPGAARSSSSLSPISPSLACQLSARSPSRRSPPHHAPLSPSLAALGGPGGRGPPKESRFLQDL
jgi:hypothetical protein